MRNGVAPACKPVQSQRVAKDARCEEIDRQSLL